MAKENIAFDSGFVFLLCSWLSSENIGFAKFRIEFLTGGLGSLVQPPMLLGPYGLTKTIQAQARTLSL
jgi:hypothetical protein